MRYFEDIAIGDTAERSFVITDQMVAAFVAFSGDDNPSHTDQGYAVALGLDRPSVNGMLYVSLMSGVLGSDLPGHASVYLSQTVRFGHDVHVGDRMVARVEVIGLDAGRREITLSTRCLVGDRLCMDGEAVMTLPARAAGQPGG